MAENDIYWKLAQLSSLHFRLYNHYYYLDNYTDKQQKRHNFRDNALKNNANAIIQIVQISQEESKNYENLFKKIKDHKETLILPKDKFTSLIKRLKEKPSNKSLAEPSPYVYASYPTPDETIFNRKYKMLKREAEKTCYMISNPMNAKNQNPTQTKLPQTQQPQNIAKCIKSYIGKVARAAG